MIRSFLGWAQGETARGASPIWHAVVREEGQDPRAACERRQGIGEILPSFPRGARLCQRIGCWEANRRQGVTASGGGEAGHVRASQA